MATATVSFQPKEILYCGVCTFPPEYCPYGSRVSKCRTWLESNHPSQYSLIYSDPSSLPSTSTTTTSIGAGPSTKTTSNADAAAATLESSESELTKLSTELENVDLNGLSKSEKKDLDKRKKEVKEGLESLKRERREDRKENKIKEKKMASKIQIKRIERTKRKHVTAVNGLEVFDIDLKKASKLFATRFATGSSVSKNNQGDEEIVIQGDVGDEVLEMLLEKTGKASEILGKGTIPEDNIVFVDEGKKKGGAGVGGAGGGGH